MTQVPAQVQVYAGSDMQTWQEHHGSQQEWNDSPLGQESYSGYRTVQHMQKNLNISKVPLKVLLWNVRGINAAKKQQYLDWLISEQKPDVVMFNETKLTSSLYMNGFTSHQTLMK